MIEAELIEDADSLESIAPEWDALAVRAGEPMASPAWALSWWRHVAPATARLRVIAVRERSRLIGLAPFYVASSGRGLVQYRPMADSISSNLALLAAPQRAWDVGAAIAQALACGGVARPDTLLLGPLEARGEWDRALREQWPGAMRPPIHRRGLQVSATVPLGGDFEDWLARRDAQFRKTVRRRTRAFEREGGVMRLAALETVDADIDAFVALHTRRWEQRGASYLVSLGAKLPLLLRDLAGRLLADGRFRLWIAEIDGHPICADLSVVAGGEVVGINTGWDERFRRLSPVQLVTVRKIEDCCKRGEQRLNMGWGSLEYKRAFADGSEPIVWNMLLLPGRSLPRALAGEAPLAAARRLWRTAVRWLPPERLDTLRTVAAPLRRRLQ